VFSWELPAGCNLLKKNSDQPPTDVNLQEIKKTYVAKQKLLVVKLFCKYSPSETNNLTTKYPTLQEFISK